MKNRVSAALACAAILVITTASTNGQTGARDKRVTLADIAWLAGAWVGQDGPVSFEERWTAAAGGAMLGISRTVKAERMIAFEFLRIVERDGRLVYVAQPGGRPPTEFSLSEIGPDTVAFENPAHDFPKVIRYTRRSDGTLEARVSDGGQRAEVFVFRRGS